MATGTHGKNDKTFEELNFSEQAKSINGQVSRLTSSIRAHHRRAIQENKDSNEVLLKSLGQIARIINNLIK